MQIDGHTVVLCGILIRTLLAILFLSFWIKDRQATCTPIAPSAVIR